MKNTYTYHKCVSKWESCTGPTTALLTMAAVGWLTHRSVEALAGPTANGQAMLAAATALPATAGPNPAVKQEEAEGEFHRVGPN